MIDGATTNGRSQPPQSAGRTVPCCLVLLRGPHRPHTNTKRRGSEDDVSSEVLKMMPQSDLNRVNSFFLKIALRSHYFLYSIFIETVHSGFKIV